MKKWLWICVCMFSPTLHAETVTFEFDPKVALSMARFEIPAPLETTRGQIDKIKGSILIDFDHPENTTGTIEADMTAVKVSTFSEEEKNNLQGEHMINWFEAGSDVPANKRQQNKWIKFTITKVVSVIPPAFKDSVGVQDEIGKAHAVRIVAQGDLTAHGITKPKTVNLDLIIYEITGKRYPEAKYVMLIRTQKPIEVSLKEHDIKPRDTSGKFLSTALSVVGLKLSDSALVTLDLRPFVRK